MTVLCVLWATLSTVVSILACAGFYLPYWIQGRLLGKADAFFSSFRRCNYPRIKGPNAAPEIVYECARYSSFWDIPSAWWQASTVTMGIGVAIAVISALTLLAAASSFLPHILKTPKHSRILGSLQLLAVMISGGLVMYPIGWDNREVRESCGKSANVYNLDVTTTTTTTTTTATTAATTDWNRYWKFPHFRKRVPAAFYRALNELQPFRDFTKPVETYGSCNFAGCAIHVSLGRLVPDFPVISRRARNDLIRHQRSGDLPFNTRGIVIDLLRT
ncbi:LHFPL tetraspan subfamily member 6 protein-like isoform X2 [Linepithema humile]|uniref:LHFPL tetraspan subfamily member 6 protein-like isoform X2 n=1 Tax=Linepithema humile TaxID=83485 RepID=UPI0006236C1A|nr:PREDICTED: lipoma HMGIC fusion partner-like isoform X2 [Linepithema humile]